MGTTATTTQPSTGLTTYKGPLPGQVMGPNGVYYTPTGANSSPYNTSGATNTVGTGYTTGTVAPSTAQQVASFAASQPGIQTFSDPLTNPMMYGGAGANEDNPYLYNTNIGGKDYLYATGGLSSGGGGAMANADAMKALGGNAVMYGGTGVGGAGTSSKYGYLFDPSKVTADQIRQAYNYTPGENPDFAKTLATVIGMAAAPIAGIALAGSEAATGGALASSSGGVTGATQAGQGALIGSLGGVGGVAAPTTALTSGTGALVGSGTGSLVGTGAGGLNAVTAGAGAAAGGATGGLGVNEALGTETLAPGETMTASGNIGTAGAPGGGGMYSGGMLGTNVAPIDVNAIPAGSEATTGTTPVDLSGISPELSASQASPMGFGSAAPTDVQLANTAAGAGGLFGTGVGPNVSLSDVGSFIGSHPDLVKTGVGAIGSLVAPALTPSSAKPPPPAPGLAATSPVQTNLAQGAETSLANQANTLYGKPFAPGDFGADMQAAIDAASQQFHALNDPIFNMQNTQLDTQLRNQGLYPGDKAYNDAMMAQQNRQSQLIAASNAQAVTAGQTEQARLFGQALTQYELPATTINSLIGTSQMGAPTLYGQQANTSTFNAAQYNQKMQQLEGLGAAGLTAALK